MAMLAEPRQRKTYNLVPRGKALYEDDCRFGTKMLKKMGWSKEKGLGAKEDGGTEFIRVQYKNNVQGFGYEMRDDQWTQHEQSFNGLLQNLNGNEKEDNERGIASDEETARVGFGFAAKEKKKKVEKLTEKISGESLEEKSKRSKARVHYKKFTRGKDLSRYSEKDLANIFGKKVVQQSNENGVFDQLTAIIVDQSNAEDEDDEQEERANFAGVQTVNTGVSVGDYFKQKMEAMRNKQRNLHSNETNEEHNNINIEESRKRSLSPEVEECVEEQLPSKKKKKKDKKNKNVEDVSDQTSSIAMKQDDELESSSLELVAKTKKKKKSKTSQSKCEEEQHSAEQDNETTSKDNTHSQKEFSTEETKKKKKSKTSQSKCEEEQHSAGPDNETTTMGNTHSLKEFSTEETKKKKKPKTSQSKCEEEQHSAEPDNETTLKDNTHSLSEISTEEAVKTSKKKRDKSSKIVEKEENESTEAPVQPLDNMPKVTEMPEKVSTNIEEEEIKEKPWSAMTTSELSELLKSYDTLKISNFDAERFRNCKLDAFSGANVFNIKGYSFNDNLELVITNVAGDEKKILELWSGKISKYEDQTPKYSYKKYARNVHKARKLKAKLPQLHVKTFKRRQAFQAI